VKLLLATALVLTLSSLAMAAPESSQLGPYSVSFDMNTNTPHELQMMQPISTQSATIYGLQIFTDNSTKARLTISAYNNQIDATLPIYKQLAAMSLALSGFNATNIEDMMIDGKSGFLISSQPFPGNTMAPAGINLFQALYWLDSVDCPCGPVSVGTTSVDVTSSYPQDVTQSLLGSIHVEKGQAASTQVMPPAQMPTQMPTQQMPTGY
jgi:hypothetical protein